MGIGLIPKKAPGATSDKSSGAGVGGGGAGSEEPRKKTTIFIANLASELTNERELRDIFSKVRG